MTKTSNIFYTFFNTMSREDKILFKDYVIDTCGITESTFYKRVKKPSLFSQLEKRTIAKQYKSTVCQIFG